MSISRRGFIKGVAAGSVAVAGTAKAGGAQKVYWIVKRANTEKVVAVDQYSYTFEAGRVAATHLEVAVKYEQFQPQLDKVIEVDGKSEMHRAVLDVCYHDSEGQQLLDVRICSPCAGEAPKVQAAALRDGEAATRQVRAKIARYGETVTPFIVEVGGRPSKEAREWVQDVVRRTVLDGHSSILGATVWAMLSCTLQRYVAIQLRKAEGRL